MTGLGLICLAGAFAVIVIGFAVYAYVVYSRALDLDPELLKKESLLKQLEELGRQHADSHRRLAEKKAEYDELCKKGEEAKQIIAKGEAMDSYIKGHQDQFNSLQKKETEAKVRLAQLGDECKEREEQLNELNKQYKDEQLRKQALEQAIEAAKADQETIRKEQKEYLASLNAQISTKQHEIELLNKQIAEMTSSKQKLDELLSKKQEELHKLQLDRASCERDLNSMKRELREWEERKKETEAAVTSGRNRLEKLHQDFESAKSSLERELHDKRGIVQDLDKEISSKKLEAARLEKNLSDTTKALKDHESRLQQAEQRLQKLQSDNAASAHMLASARQQLKECEKKKEETEAFIAAKKGEISQLNEKYARLSSEAVSSQQCWADLDTPLPNIIKPSASHYPKSEKKWYDDFVKTLDSCNIQFNFRLLNAFHTSLKVQELSPLVVLAGISGTGKSLLPELYAHAAGMNFLQVAVQPRWDSPQDMLGFYNYMEGRFKATELSRLLWQSDSFNNKAASVKSMNIVLLDEMNLARVEYYFSDMLSKLEVRRGIDARQAEQRQAAEIEIDCGASSGPMKKRRLFISPQTLFVGTMNEDESTQSLSDKVMDRANMIRFGRPQKLRVKPTSKKDFIEHYKQEPTTLTLQIWEQWHKEANSSTASHLNDELQEINELLTGVGRPFGHRVAQSIMEYVANYPQSDTAENTYRWAVADQIEMKVLPKLNGLDKDNQKSRELLSGLGDIIERHDRDLAQAFRETADNTQEAFFQWRGLIR